MRALLSHRFFGLDTPPFAPILRPIAQRPLRARKRAPGDCVAVMAGVARARN